MALVCKLKVVNVFIHLQCPGPLTGSIFASKLFLRVCGRRGLGVQKLMTRERLLKKVASIRSVSYFIAGAFLLMICIWYWTGNHLCDTKNLLQCGILWFHGEVGILSEGMRPSRIMSMLRNPNMSCLLHLWMTGQCRLIKNEEVSEARVRAMCIALGTWE